LEVGIQLWLVCLLLLEARHSYANFLDSIHIRINNKESKKKKKKKKKKGNKKQIYIYIFFRGPNPIWLEKGPQF
jgi:hypothetical protein